MKGDFQVRFRENLRVQLPWVTRLPAIGSDKFVFNEAAYNLLAKIPKWTSEWLGETLGFEKMITMKRGE